MSVEQVKHEQTAPRPLIVEQQDVLDNYPHSLIQQRKRTEDYLVNTLFPANRFIDESDRRYALPAVLVQENTIGVFYSPPSGRFFDERCVIAQLARSEGKIITHLLNHLGEFVSSKTLIEEMWPGENDYSTHDEDIFPRFWAVSSRLIIKLNRQPILKGRYVSRIHHGYRWRASQ